MNSVNSNVNTKEKNLYNEHIYVIMEVVEVSKEELMNFVQSGKGYLLKYRQVPYRYGYAEFRFTNGEDELTLKVKVNSKKEYEVLKDAVKEALKAQYDRVTYKEEKEEESDEGSKEKEEGKTSLRLAESLKLLDRTFAQQIAAYAKRQAWFSEIIEDLGISTLFMVLQLAHIPPEKWYDEIRKYKDEPKKFMEFADKYLVALFEAKEDAEKLIEIRSKWYYTIAEREALRAKLIEYTKLLNEAITQLNACTSMLSPKQLQKYTMWTALRKMAEARPQVEVVEKGDEDGS